MDTIIAAAKIDGIHIQLQNLILRIIFLQFKSDKQLGHLPQERLFLGKIHVFCQLLRNGASPLQPAFFPSG